MYRARSSTTGGSLCCRTADSFCASVSRAEVGVVLGRGNGAAVCFSGVAFALGPRTLPAFPFACKAVGVRKTLLLLLILESTTALPS